MKNYMQSLCNQAKKNKDIKMMRALYQGNPNDSRIKFEYAKLLININNDAKKKNMEEYEEARNLLVELLDTRNRKYALFELGKLEGRLDNLEKSKECYIELLNGFDSDKEDKEHAILELGRIEVYMGNIDNARKYFRKLLNTSSKSLGMLELGRLEIEHGNSELGKSYLYKLINSQSQNEEYAKTLLVIAYLREKKYEEAVKIIEKYDANSKYRTLLYLSKKLNIFFKGAYNNLPCSYSVNQILEYDEYLAIDHITDRHNSDLKGTKFNPNIDVYKLFMDIKKELTEENKISKLILNDIYIINYPNIGINGENYLKVITIHDSQDILSMYPVHNDYVIDDEELEEELLFKPKTKQKTIKR